MSSRAPAAPPSASSPRLVIPNLRRFSGRSGWCGWSFGRRSFRRRSNSAWLTFHRGGCGARIGSAGHDHLRFLGVLCGTCFGLREHLVVFLFILIEIRDVEERVPLQANVDERRLHAGKNPADTPLVDSTHEPDVNLALVIDFDQLVVFQHGDLRLMRRR